MQSPRVAMTDTERILFRARVKTTMSHVAPMARAAPDSPLLLSSLPMDAGLSAFSTPESVSSMVLDEDDGEQDVFFGPITMREQCLRRIHGATQQPVAEGVVGGWRMYLL